MTSRSGAGRALRAGLDLKEMSDPNRKRKAIADPPKLLRSLRQPVIGAINGIAVTGGFEIALSCDLLIATPEARFADTHARVGLLSGWGLSARLSRAIGPGRAKELSLITPAASALARALPTRNSKEAVFSATDRVTRPVSVNTGGKFGAGGAL